MGWVLLSKCKFTQSSHIPVFTDIYWYLPKRYFSLHSDKYRRNEWSTRAQQRRTANWFPPQHIRAQEDWLRKSESNLFFTQEFGHKSDSVSNYFHSEVKFTNCLLSSKVNVFDSEETLNYVRYKYSSLITTTFVTHSSISQSSVWLSDNFWLIFFLPFPPLYSCLKKNCLRALTGICIKTKKFMPYLSADVMTLFFKSILVLNWF